MKPIILASTSPRRKEIFSKFGLPFEVVSSNYEEDMTLPLSPDELAKHLSAGKARAVAEAYRDRLVIAADTFVVFEHHRLGKPKTFERTVEMLRILRGKKHEVVTGVTLIDLSQSKELRFTDTTSVYMKPIADEMIEAYARTGEPFDKAGAYAFQGLGALFVERIEGDYFNVIGLPFAKLGEALGEFGVRIFS